MCIQTVCVLVFCCVLKKKTADWRCFVASHCFFSISCHECFIFFLNFISSWNYFSFDVFHLCHKRKHTHIQLHCGEACLHYRLHIATLRTQKNKNDAWHCQICPLSFKLSIFCNCRRLICWGQRSLLVQHSFSPCVRMIPTLKELGLTFHFIMIINVNMVNFKAGADWNIRHVHAIFKQEQ